jgi:cytochrome P450
VVRLDEIDLTDLDRFANGFPHELFTTLRREAPVWFHAPTAHTPGGEGFWVLTRYADIHAAGADAELFSSETGPGRDGGGGTLIEDLPAGLNGALLNMMNDPRHQRIRRLVTPAVSARALGLMEDELRTRTAAIVDAVADRGECDFLVEVAAELPLQAIAQLMGVPQEDRHDLFRWSDATFDYDDRELGERSAKTQDASANMQAYGIELIDRKRLAPGEDILSAVVGARIEGPAGDEPLSDVELLMFFNLLIGAGSETTRNSIAVGAMALAEHPDQWRDLQDDRALLPSAVEEILRWASSTPYNRRTATRTTEVGGQPIAAGDKLTLWWASANRDESVFLDPFRFDIRRDPNPHLTFGHGSHFCLGASLARLEIRLVLDALLDRFGEIVPDGPVEWARSNKHTGVRHMPVKFVTRS